MDHIPPGGPAGIVIIGGGLAGLFCALKLGDRPVTLITAAPIGHGAASAWAQGGIAAAIGEGDTPQAHAADTIVVGGGLVDEAIAHLIADEASARIQDLLAYGVPFDRDLEGRLALSREAAHSARRIVRVGGDLAGRRIMDCLIAALRARPNIRVMEHWTLTDLVRNRSRIAGVDLRHVTDPERVLRLPASAIVLATGGIGHLYAVTTNPVEARGDGLAAAARAGAVLADTEFVQFHPTAIHVGRDPAPLATEALRGEGAVLVNKAGQRFMPALHPDAELAPRDVVARGVFAEIAAGRGAFLDARAAIGERFAEAFPTVHAACIAGGVDPVVEPIPVAPAAHYHMGGILTDAQGRTTLDGLWACGETASTGAHGANRLASNSLLEALVFAARTAEDIINFVPRTATSVLKPLPPVKRTAFAPRDQAAEREIRDLMSRSVGVLRERSGLVEAARRLAEMEATASEPGLRNMATAGLLIATAALQRHESRGAQARTDYPGTDPVFARRTFLKLEDARAIAAETAPREIAHAG